MKWLELLFPGYGFQNQTENQLEKAAEALQHVMTALNALAQHAASMEQRLTKLEIDYYNGPADSDFKLH